MSKDDARDGKYVQGERGPLGKLYERVRLLFSDDD